MKYNFTLIVPTHNRHNYLKRSIEYFKDLKATVIYCDSSENRYSGYIEENMVYLHLPGKKFIDKMLIALNEVKTDFIATCADDDFVLIKTLHKGSCFLENNYSYAAVVGRNIGFKANFNGEFLYSRTVPNDLNFTPDVNAKIFFKNYYQIFWAMYKKDVFQTFYNIVSDCNFKNDNFQELVAGAICCYSGGIKFIEDIWGVREQNEGNHWGARHKSLNDIFINTDIKNDYMIFKAQIDKNTRQGYGKLVFHSYIGSYNYKLIKHRVKIILKIFISKKLSTMLRRIQSSIKDNQAPESTSIKKLAESDYHKYKLVRIKNILEH